MFLRKKLIKLAHEHPEMREHLLPLLKQAMEFPTQDALDTYLKAHPGADKSNHSVAKEKALFHPTSQKSPAEEHLQDLNPHARGIVSKMPTKWHDKDTGYKLKEVKEAAKEIAKLPIRKVNEMLVTLEKKKRDIDSLYADHQFKGDTQLPGVEDAQAQITSAWRAAKLAAEQVRRDAETREEKNPGGKYLPKAEMKKRVRVPDSLKKDLEDWESSAHNDPVHKVLQQFKNDWGYVRTDVVDKALAHLKELAKQPAHHKDAWGIGKLVEMLAKETGR